MEDTRQPKIENIYILKGTQVDSKNTQLRRGCYLEPFRVYKIDKKYDSIEKLTSGATIKFKISLQDAARLILENKAINVIKKDNKWVAANIFGEKLDEDIKIKANDDKKKEAA